MTAALWLLALQGTLGAFDTLYYHELRARLPARPEARTELTLHAARDLAYAVLFGSLPWFEWRGAWAWVLAGLLATEIAITLTDFVVEDRVRRPQGGVFAGERVTHAIMGIIYGGFLACLAPVWTEWKDAATAFAPGADVPGSLRWVITTMAVGVLFSGLRDGYAALGLPGGGFPWKSPAPEDGAR